MQSTDKKIQILLDVIHNYQEDVIKYSIWSSIAIASFLIILVYFNEGFQIAIDSLSVIISVFKESEPSSFGPFIFIYMLYLIIWAYTAYNIISLKFNFDLEYRITSLLTTNEDICTLKKIIIDKGYQEIFPLNAFNKILATEYDCTIAKYNNKYSFKWLVVFLISIFPFFVDDITSSPYYHFINGLSIIVLFFIIVIAILMELGKITLSEQSLAHRRNTIYLFLLAIFIEAFQIKINFGLLIDYPAKQINIIKGAIGFFAFYSLLEYTYNLIKDMVDQDSQSSKKGNGFLYFLIGVPRAMFDIVAPFLAGYVTINLFYDDSLEFIFKVTSFVKTELNDIIESHHLTGLIDSIIESVKQHK